MPIISRFLRIFLGLLAAGQLSHAQTVVRYGADFMAEGVGAEALGMGGAFTAYSHGVQGVYWNPASTSDIDHAEMAYMHAERFAGLVSLDYGAFAWPVGDRSTVGVAFIRSAINQIPNTLDAWDAERNRPKPLPETYFSTFNAVDAAFLGSLGWRVSPRWQLGTTLKMIRRKIGPFAQATGFSVDVGLKYMNGPWRWAAVLQDATGMWQAWRVNENAFASFEEAFDLRPPEGNTEIVLPVLRMGAVWGRSMGVGRIDVSVDVGVAFDGQQAWVFHTGPVSYHPSVGFSYAYRDIVFLRSGISNIAIDPWTDRLSLSPALGAGVAVKTLHVDYSFGHFSGVASELGYSHRISLRLQFEGNRFSRQR